LAGWCLVKAADGDRQSAANVAQSLIGTAQSASRKVQSV
jgi:hypothetical protein